MAPGHTKLGARLRSIRRRIYGGRVIDGTPDRKGVVRWLVRSAGDDGHAGHVPTLRAESGSDSFGITGGDMPSDSGIPGTLDPDDDEHVFSDLLDGAE